MNKKSYKYIASICFALVLVNIVSPYLELLAEGEFNPGLIITLIFPGLLYVIVIIGMLTAIPLLSTVGFALLILSNILSLPSVLRTGDSPLILFNAVLGIVAFVFMMLSTITLRKAKKNGMIAAIISVIRIVVALLSGGLNVLFGVFIAAGAMFTGLACESLQNRTMLNVAAPIQNSNTFQQGTLEDDKVEKLLSLKSFLDKGIITQEEFEEKKKQLLDK